jgi:hypothetical protein
MEFKSKDEYVKSVQKALDIITDGIDGPATWEAIRNKLAPQTTQITDAVTSTINPQITDAVTQLSDKALKLILDYEVGGGQSYYNKELKHPSYPGGASGVTIGVGYDLGYNTSEQFTKDWRSLLTGSDFIRLAKCLGSKGAMARDLVSGVRDIEVPWDGALVIFKQNTIPRFIKETIKAFPGADQLHPDAFGALVSLVFNRGSAVTGTNRSQMMNIKNLIPSKNYVAISEQIIDMKRIWAGKNLDGLLKRRDEEAALIKSCV